jgi:hypothetical protein
MADGPRDASSLVPVPASKRAHPKVHKTDTPERKVVRKIAMLAVGALLETEWAMKIPTVTGPGLPPEPTTNRVIADVVRHYLLSPGSGGACRELRSPGAVPFIWPNADQYVSALCLALVQDVPRNSREWVHRSPRPRGFSQGFRWRR